MNHITKTCPNYESWGEENLRLAALDMINQLSYLCDQAYFDQALDAVKKGPEAKNTFIKLCKQVGICDELIPLLWKMLQATIEGPAAGWLPIR